MSYYFKLRNNTLTKAFVFSLHICAHVYIAGKKEPSKFFKKCFSILQTFIREVVNAFKRLYATKKLHGKTGNCFATEEMNSDRLKKKQKVMIFNNKYNFDLFDFPTLLPRLAKLSQCAILLFRNLVQLFSVTQNNLTLKNISS